MNMWTAPCIIVVDTLTIYADTTQIFCSELMLSLDSRLLKRYFFIKTLLESLLSLEVHSFHIFAFVNFLFKRKKITGFKDYEEMVERNIIIFLLSAELFLSISFNRGVFIIHQLTVISGYLMWSFHTNLKKFWVIFNEPKLSPSCHISYNTGHQGANLSLSRKTQNNVIPRLIMFIDLFFCVCSF